MKTLFAWLSRPPVITFLLVAVVSLLAWFEAPLFAFDGKAPFATGRSRWILIALLFAAWGLYYAWKALRARLASMRLLAGVAGADQPEAPARQQVQEEAALLATRMKEAIAVLRKARLGGSRAGLYRLPWYVFVGAPGSGKTTALLNSGLNFPLAGATGKAMVDGVGGTRHCDWWFSDEAVLLDTAGRYTTHDSDTEADKAAWTAFLRLLRRHRRRRPINGVMLALSVPDLLEQGACARRAQALAVRARIRELHEELGIRFPVYVVLTKCDLLAGFTEFFDDLGRDERAQVWGMTFARGGAAQPPLQRFPAEFEALARRLQERVVDRMQQERDLQRRAVLYNFPQQFAALQAPLQAFLGEAFGANAYEDTAWLRGVYLTSGTQEGSPIDRVLATLAASFGLERRVLPPNPFGGRSYFLTGLLREVVFAERELAGASLKIARNRRLLQWAALAACALLLAGAAAGIAGSYVANRHYVDDIAARTANAARLAAAVPGDASPLALLPLLDALRAMPGGYRDRGQATPWHMGFGLYQGGKLGDGAIDAYRRALRQALVPRALARLEQELRRGSANNADYLYELLRVYLMLGERRHLDADAVRAWADLDWSRVLQADEAQRQALLAHVAAMLEDEAAEPPRLDAGLVAQARLQLAHTPAAERAYRRAVRALAQERLPELDVATMAGRDAPLVLARVSGQPLTRGVPGAFTLAGYRKFGEQLDMAIAALAQESWVLDRRDGVDSPEDAAATRAQATRLYYDEYIRRWDALLADVTLAPVAGLDQGAREAGLLAGAGSPLRKFIIEAARQTTPGAVAPPKSGVELASGAVKSLRDAAARRIAAAFGDDSKPPAAPAPKNPVDLHFEALHAMAAPGADGAPAALDQVLARLKDVAAFFDAASAARAAGTAAPPAAALAALGRDADAMPPPLSALVKAIGASAAALGQGSERARIDALWADAAGPFCRRAIAGRYPLVRGAAQEATPDDFGRFFGPGGMMDDFFLKNLQPYVEMGGPRWRWRAVNGVAPGLPQEVLDEFQRAAAIRDSFFAAGGSRASMRFELKLASADPAITGFSLDIDGQPFAYTAGTGPRAARFQVPSGKGVDQVRLVATPGGELKTEGPWAWLRMIDKGVLAASPQAERYRLAYDVGGHKLVFDLVASSVNNPFRRAPLEQFRCREHL